MFILNSRFLTQNLTGVQRYGYELFKQLSNSQLDFRCFLPNQPVNNTYQVDQQIDLQKIGKNQSHVWEQIDLPSYLRKNGSPLLLNLCNTAPLFYKNQIVTVHDIAYMRGNWHSRSFRAFYKTVIPKVIKNSHHVITVSEFSKQEIMSAYGTPGEKISVIYNAPFIANTLTDATEIEKMVLDKPFILSVGSMDLRKNLKRLIQAFLLLKNKNIKLLLTGSHHTNFKSDPELGILLNNNKDRIVFLGYRTDAELTYLYKNALCFVYPSLYEGFGIPPIEAMMNNCPVVTSNVSSLPEVCGDGALYCDPLSINDIAASINTMIENQDQRAKYILAGAKNASKYSWQLSGDKLKTLINNYI
ncbi:glycosyltransferase family 1 protein [Mucilaginibacter sp. dw_454]|uniref:glycosyltransferase family 4 protein n=1 Tax=Mucilaginibacter sp. dw_454 TaxID=2720079 RepID=UPI001BD4A616|nr:glycosyltransferase family 1 protein [Mucilaginibacter sp. dw_454]